MKFLVRQPILNRARELFGYELLLRTSLLNSCEELNLKFAVVQGRAEWDQVSALETEVSEEQVSAMYFSAADWSTALRSPVHALVHACRITGLPWN